MPRSALRVREAQPRDLPSLVDLAGELREALLPSAEAGLRPTTPPGRAVLRQRLRAALDHPDRQLVVVESEAGETLGMALLTLADANALYDSPAVHMTHAVVGDRYRRRGAGRALVAAAVAYAEERGTDQVVVAVRPGSREANRFFARLGFAPLALRRAASVATLRRSLASHDVPVGRLRSRRAPVAAVVPQPSPTAVPAPADS
ncbi:MAG TPA: GNAT family N-acetyltransferase [Mycobacteriales bacterium]|nr:GNAT family N-acetyltransferase [Mycobacteriales bacterium]